MFKIYKLLILFISLVLLSFQAYGADFVLKAAHNGGSSHPFDDGYQKFKQVIETETNGRVEVQIFPGEQLGTEEQVNEMLQSGTSALNISGSAALSNWVPEAELFNLPFIFRDSAHMYRVLDGPIGERLAKSIEKKLDVVFLGWMYSGNRNAWNNKKPIKSPSDMKGLKLRVMGSAVLVDTFNALGAQATPMSFGEVYTSLQQGVIDGAETDHIDLQVEKFYEVTKYVSLTGHMFLPASLIMSRKVYDKLPVDIQTVVHKAGHAATNYERMVIEGKTLEALDFLKKKGIKFYEVDKKPFQDAVKSVYTKNAKRVGGMATIRQVNAQ